MNKMTNSRRSSHGLGLVELMVGMVIGMITLLVVTQIMQSFESQKRTSTGGNDAQTNGALALYTLDREIRMAGYGVIGPEGLLCQDGINTYYDPKDGGAPQVQNGADLLPILIIDGGADNPDSIAIMRSDADFGAIPTSVVKGMPTPSSIITANSSGGLSKGDLFIMAAKDGSKLCTLMQMSQDPQVTGNGVNLQHNSGNDSPYNPPNPEKVFEVAPVYAIGDLVINMGNYIRRRYSVLCDRLTEVDPLLVAVPTCANSTTLFSHIVNVQAVYGVASGANPSEVNEWLPATGAWANPTSAMIARIKAIRIAVVARNPQYEKDVISPDSLLLWENGPEITLTEDERHFRYRVFETIVPLRNLIWAS